MPTPTNRTYETALFCAYQDGAEKVANPSNPECNITNAKFNFAFYAGVDKFSDPSAEQKKDFWSEWNRGVNAEKEAQGS